MIPVYIAIGVVAGILAGIFGIGGGIVVVPALVFFAKMPQKNAIGTSLSALLLPAGALGAYTYWRAGHVDVSAALWISLGMFTGAFSGAVLAQLVTDLILKRAFAVLLAAIAARLWIVT